MSDRSLLDQIDTVEINLTVGETVYLQLVMTRSGMVNRRGDGESADAIPVMGRPEEPIFDSFLSAIPLDLFDQAGRYAMPDPQGDPSELIISFTGEGLDTGFAFQYGSASMGPPDEFVELVELALALTDDWYQGKKKRKR